jgi:hypothetical protein
MRAAFEIVEAAAIIFLIGLVVILGVAALVHTLLDPPETKKARLEFPPAGYFCPLNHEGHCAAKAD